MGITGATASTCPRAPAEKPGAISYAGSIETANAYQPTAETDQDSESKPFFRRLFQRSEAEAAEATEQPAEPAGDQAQVLPESNPHRTAENAADADKPRKKGGIIKSVLSVFSSSD